LINECDTPVNLQEISLSQVNSVFPVIYCTNQNNIDDKLNWAPCILKKIQQDQYEIFHQHETFNVSEGLFWDGDEGLCKLWSTFFKYPTKKFLRAFFSQIANGSDDCENSINSSNDGVNDSQPLISVNSFNADDQINAGAGHDISHNKDKRPSVEDDKSSSSDQSSNDSDSDNDDVGATPSRGKNAKSLLNLRQRILPTAMNRGVKKPKIAPQYKSSSESDSDNDDVGAQTPIGKKWKESLESTMKNCIYCAKFRRQNPQSPTPIQIPLCIPDISLPPLRKRLVYSESNYTGDHKFFLLPLPKSNSSIHIAFQGRIMEHAQGHQYCIFLNFRRQHR
jgi:hypothetical protein